MKRSETTLIAGDYTYRSELCRGSEEDRLPYVDALHINQPIERAVGYIFCAQFWEIIHKREGPLDSGLTTVLLDYRILPRVIWNAIQNMDGGKVCIEEPRK